VAGEIRWPCEGLRAEGAGCALEGGLDGEVGVEGGDHGLW